MPEPVGRRGAPAVVAYLDLHLVGAVADDHVRVAGACVLEHVRQALLNDAIGREVEPSREGVRVTFQMKLDWQSRAADLCEERVEAVEPWLRHELGLVAVAEERSRIARELHDIVAHAVSVMVLQVGAVRHNLPQELAADGDALKDVEHAGRSALAEMRRLLGAMHDGEDADLAPQPGLDSLDALVERVVRAGLPVRLQVEGDAVPLPRAVDLSAYRIVQEGLTNSLKHANASRADVTVRYAPDAVQLEIRDDGAGAGTTDGLGHGLVGVRERVKIYGGEMKAGTAPEGGFVLSARLPVEGRRR